MAGARITLLGTGTCQLEAGRAAASILTDFGSGKLLFDCGRAVTQRLAELGLANDEIQHIIISHFHPDHISDLIPLLQAGSWSRTDPRTVPLHIYGPPGLEQQMIRLLSLFDGSSLLRGNFPVHLHEHHGDHLQLFNHTFELVRLPHAENHGLRFAVEGRRIAYTGDCEFSPAEVEFLRDVDLAVVDAGHLKRSEIIMLAVESAARTMVCSHLYEPLEQVALNFEADKCGYTGTIIVARDLMTFEV